MGEKKNIFIGTSGWTYKHWNKTFFPDEVPKKDWLKYYADRLGSVEINGTFYRLQSMDTFKKWKEAVPDDFIFSVKGSRYITHNKKLNDPKEHVKKLMDGARGLGKKLGPILYQLPPGWKKNYERLEIFLKALSKKQKHAVEFRNNTWWSDDIFELLKKYNASFCIYQLAGVTSPKEITADFIYIRLHGPEQTKYTGKYDDKDLSSWKNDFSKWIKKGKVKEIYCYFDNDQEGYAAQNAVTLNEMVHK